MCQLIDVKRNGFYRHLNRANSPRPDDGKRAEIIEWIYKIAKASEYSYGSRRMKKALNLMSFLTERHKSTHGSRVISIHH